MTTIILLTIADIVALVAVLALYLFLVGRLLSNIADNLETCNEHIKTIIGHAELIKPGVEHINRTGEVVSGALPLLYGLGEQLAARVMGSGGRRTEGDGIPNAQAEQAAGQVSGRRRSRLTEAVGYRER